MDWNQVSRFLQENAFYNIALVLFLSAGLGALGLMLRQPLVVAFLAAGVVVGPSCLKVLQHGQIELLAQIGISLLLFVVGLRLDLHMIRVMGPVALATGLGQVLFTSVFGFLIALGLGMNVVTSSYVSVALTFSSTIIIVKLLSDKKEIDALHGRIAVGFLIVQDIVAILAMIGLTALGGGLANNEMALGQVVKIALKGVGFLAVVGLLMRYVLPWLLRRLAHSHELLTLFSIAWAVFLGAAGDALGFSKEVGAFLGGVSLASTSYREAIGARLVGVRDFLLLFFFIDLGARLELSALGGNVWQAIVFSLFVLIGNPLVVMVIMGAMGYRRRTGFMAGLTVAQISEFSLIMAALGVRLGHIGAETLGVVTLVGVVTICVSTYMIIYSGPLYALLGPWLKVFERKNPYREAEGGASPAGPQVDVILLGLGSYGSKLAEELLERRKRVIGVDFDPQALERARKMGMEALYGDCGDPEMLGQLPIDRAAWVVSAVRDRRLNMALLRLLRERGFGGKVALTARDEREAREFQEVGAHVALRPFSDAAEQA
ncbi:MAG TPA: cation:proton antiporter, partial [Candidatus Brocadiia bacterium]|nr:cation:proton antiporter [Candidatus Brocadiia bacterium]